MSPVPPLPPPTPAGRPAWGRWVLGGLLVLAIFALGTQPAPVFAAFTRFWQAAFGAVGLGGLLERVQRGSSQQLTTRSLPAMLTYGVLYVGLCLALLRLLAGRARHWYQALALYGAVLALCGLLLLLGRLSGHGPAFYPVVRRLIDFLTSPLPVILLLPLLSPAIRRALTRPA